MKTSARKGKYRVTAEVKAKPKTPEFMGYVQYYLDDLQKSAIKSNIATPPQMCDKATEWIEDDYRLTLGWDYYSECYSVSLFDMKVGRQGAGYVLAARHSDLLTAFSTLAWLHEVAFADGWDVSGVKADRDVNW